MRSLTHILILGIVLIFFSCDKGFEELNVNPNISESTDPAYLFAQSQHKYFTDYFHGVLTETWALNIWMQTQADINGISSVDDTYFMGGDALDNTWRLYYAEVLGNLDAARRIAEEKSQVKQAAVFTVFKSIVVQQLTDLWGDIPYSDAFGAINETGEPNFTPAYDSQRDVYLSLIDELYEASNTLDGDGELFGAEDWIYQGNETQWHRLANSMILKLCLRMSNVEPDLSSSLAEDVLAEDDFLQTDDGAYFPHSSFARSPFYELHNTGQGMRNPSQFMIDLMKETNDPRLSSYAELAPQTIILGAPDYVGVSNFLISSEIDPDDLNAFTTSYISVDFQDEDRPEAIMSFSELQFLLAEAALKDWPTAQSSSQHFTAAIESDMVLHNVDNSLAQDYLDANVWDNTMESIAREKWKTMIYTNPIEQFTEWRRTGFPILKDAAGEPIDPDQVPKRLAYPNSEISLNGNNVSSVGEGINDFTSPLWWDID